MASLLFRLAAELIHPKTPQSVLEFQNGPKLTKGDSRLTLFLRTIGSDRQDNDAAGRELNRHPLPESAT
jgi:hypothetical protein